MRAGRRRRGAWLPTLAVAAAAEALAHFLSLTWGFAALILAFVFFAIRVSSAMASTAAKAYTTETRVNAILPVLATHAAGITTAQNTANGAQSTANTANAAANNAQGTANTANNTANNALPSGGGTISGNLTITGQIGVHGGGTNVGLWTTDDLTVGGAGLSIPQANLALSSSPPNGTGGASQYCGNFYTGSGAANWASDVTNAVNACIGTLRNLGLI